MIFQDIFLENFANLKQDLGIQGNYHSESLVRRPISKKLINYFNGDTGHNLDLEGSFLGFGLIHYGLIRNIKPKHVLCIGSRKGYIPAILALACRDNGFGHVDFIDASYGEEEPTKHWSGIGFWKKIDPKHHFNTISVGNYIDTFIMTTQEFVVKYPKKKYQYIYIDGDHSYEGVKLDFKLFWPKLGKNNLMLFHDVVAKGYLAEGKFGVWKFWKELKNENKITFPFPKKSGLGILQKK